MNAKKMPRPSTLPTLNTRRYPRTMQEAFGPYASNKISEPKQTGYPVLWWVAMAVIAVASAIAIWAQA